MLLPPLTLDILIFSGLKITLEIELSYQFLLNELKIYLY